MSIDTSPNNSAIALKDHRHSQQVPEENASFLGKFLEEFKAVCQQLVQQNYADNAEE